MNEVWLAVEVWTDVSSLEDSAGIEVLAFSRRVGAATQLRTWAEVFYSGTYDPVRNARHLVYEIDRLPDDGGRVMFGAGHHVFLKRLEVA
jgi:hypothetical protein